MKLDIISHRGDASKPAIIFIHGMGMDKGMWDSPMGSTILGGRYPVSLLMHSDPEPRSVPIESSERPATGLSLGKPPEDLTTLFHDLRGLGYTVIAWSQSRPSAEIRHAVSELEEVIEIHTESCRSGVVLIGHSRGGLVGRKYLSGGDPRVKCLITLGTPHRGSRMAQWVNYLSPLLSLINPLLSDSERGTLSYIVKRIVDFLRSAALRELLPDSPFLRSLDDIHRAGIYYLSIGGTDPTLFSLYRNYSREIHEGCQKKIMVTPQKILSVPVVFENVIPKRLFPDEMKMGRGDGLVSTESARLSWADMHHDYHVNHAGMLFDQQVRAAVLNFLQTLPLQHP